MESNILTLFLDIICLKMGSCIPDIPQQNGTTEEKKNHHLMEVIRVIMFTSGVPKSF